MRTIYCYFIPSQNKEGIMNKLVLALITATALGLSAAAYAQDTAAPMHHGVHGARVAVIDKQASAVDQMKSSHRIGTRKAMIAHHRTAHRGSFHARQYNSDKNVSLKRTSPNKKVLVKPAPASGTVKTKASS
jgi:hypothetical protein